MRIKSNEQTEEELVTAYSDWLGARTEAEEFPERRALLTPVIIAGYEETLEKCKELGLVDKEERYVYLEPLVKRITVANPAKDDPITKKLGIELES